jgi:hypothetical protein
MVEVLLMPNAVLFSEPAETLLFLEATELGVDADDEATEMGEERGEEGRSKSRPQPMATYLPLSIDVLIAGRRLCACEMGCDCGERRGSSGKSESAERSESWTVVKPDGGGDFSGLREGMGKSDGLSLHVSDGKGVIRGTMTAIVAVLLSSVLREQIQ